MTRQEAASLTGDEITERIAKFCPEYTKFNEEYTWMWNHSTPKRFEPYRDLNAMFVAEGAIKNQEQLQAYRRALAQAVSQDAWCQIHATAAERAEAFLMAMC